MTTIYEALGAVMTSVQGVGKTGLNRDQGYNFRGVDAVVNAVGPKFREHGIIPTPHASTAAYRDVQTSRGKPSRECTVSVTYRFYGPAGDFVEATVPGESMDSGDKGTAKAMSVAYRIALLQVLCIPTDEPDPDQTSHERDWRPRETYAPAPQPDQADDPVTLAKRRAWAAVKAKNPGQTNEALTEIVLDALRSIGHQTFESADVAAWDVLAEEWAA